MAGLTHVTSAAEVKAPVASRPRRAARRPLLELKLHHYRLYQLLRRASLAFTWLFIVAVPVWHLRGLVAASAGAAGGSPAAELGEKLGLPADATTLLGGTWTVRLFGFELMDPLAGLGVLLTGHGELKLLWALLPTVALLVLLGRYFCGWVCPYAALVGLSNGVRALLARLGVELPNVRLPRRTSYVVLAVVLLATAALGLQLGSIFYPPAAIPRAVLHAVLFGSLGTTALVVAAAFSFDTFVSRAGFCAYLCPGGALMGLLGALSPVRVKRDAATCTDCGVCDEVCNMVQSPMRDDVALGCDRCGKCISVCKPGSLELRFERPTPIPLRTGRASLPIVNDAPAEPPARAPVITTRRALLTAAPLTAIAALLVGPKKARARQLRPPAAAPGEAFEARCIRCQRCAEVCPPKAIRFDARVDAATSDVPYIDARASACILCMKCTDACPTGALAPTPAEPLRVAEVVRMGRPVLDEHKCLAWNGRGVCRLCFYVCPYPEKAVALTGTNHGPKFNADHCVGCGLCEQACPEVARAIHIEPIA